ncbi:MAG: TonB-dependent receptor [Sphingobacteriia bacterium]|nr:TonB-dependent receptor [Sphingobacteriia bacterium]
MKYLAVFIFIWLIAINILGQTTLQGCVSDTTGEGLPRINILVYLPEGKALIAFAVSDEKGYFSTDVNSPSDSLKIEVSSINYRKEIKTIANKTQTLNFRLVFEAKEIEGVSVRSFAIEKRKDTLSYLVSSFARKEDRAIEDVLKRMPGIAVEPSGRVLYQGLPVEKFYVEGLDLMNGRYVVVSKNLPQGSVSAVEILENHQPLRILEDRVTSQQASLNLKLKRDVTVTGTAKTGVGASPLLWDVNVTPMAFTKNFQLLTSYQSNNNGNDVAQQLEALSLHDFLKNIDRPYENPEILSIQHTSPPEISQNRYLDNNIHLLNFNGLQRISGDYQLRANLFYINDYQSEKAALQRTLYNPTDTLTFTELFDNKLFKKYFYGEFTLNRNVKTNYLNNEFKIQSRWDNQTGLVYDGNDYIKQSLNIPFSAVSNEMRSVNPIGNQLVEFNSFISYDNHPHNLRLNPGQFEDVLNSGVAYETVNQHLNLKRFFTDNSAGFIVGWKRLSFSPRLGFSYRDQLLESSIYKSFQENELKVEPGFENQLDGRHSRIYLNTDVEYKKSNLTIKVRMPLSLNQIHMSDSKLNQGQKLERLFLDPSLSVDYKISNFWRTRVAWGITNRLDDIDGIYYGYVLRSYRNLSQNAAPISETFRQNFSAFLSYRNPITSFFNTLSYVYVVSQNNLTYSTSVQDDGTSVIVAENLPQTNYLQSIHGYSSKYFSGLKSTLSLRVNYSQLKAKSLLNDELFNTKNQFLNVKPSLGFRISSWVNSDYEMNASFIRTFIENNRKSNISMLRHVLNLFAFPAKNQLISLSSEYYHYGGNDNFFVDALYRYTLTDRKIDLELRWNNIFNNQTYTTLQASSFTVFESTYNLRPSQVFISVRFSF